MVPDLNVAEEHLIEDPLVERGRAPRLGGTLPSSLPHLPLSPPPARGKKRNEIKNWMKHSTLHKLIAELVSKGVGFLALVT